MWFEGLFVVDKTGRSGSTTPKMPLAVGNNNGSNDDGLRAAGEMHQQRYREVNTRSKKGKSEPSTWQPRLTLTWGFLKDSHGLAWSSNLENIDFDFRRRLVVWVFYFGTGVCTECSLLWNGGSIWQNESKNCTNCILYGNELRTIYVMFSSKFWVSCFFGHIFRKAVKSCNV